MLQLSPRRRFNLRKPGTGILKTETRSIPHAHLVWHALC